VKPALDKAFEVVPGGGVEPQVPKPGGF